MQVRATPTAGILVRALALGACHLGVGGCAVAAPASASAPQEAAPAPTATVARTVELYVADRRALERFYPIDATPVRAARLAQRAQAELEALAAVDFAALDLDDRVDHVLLRHELAYELALYAEEQARLARLAPLLPFAERIERLDDARRRSAALEPADAAQTLTELAAEVEAVSARLTRADAAAPDEADDAEAPAEDPLPVSAADALWIGPRLGSLRRALREWYRHHADYEPGFAWWCEQPFDALDAALIELMRALREDVGGQTGGDDDPLVGDPIGRDALLRDLRHEMLAYTPEELVAIGERELAWCRAELERAATDLGLAGDWRAALEHVKGLHVPPGEQDTLVAALATEAVAWLDEHDLVTIPDLCRETWRVRMIPADDQRFYPFAFYGGQEVDVAYPTAEMEHDTKLMAMRGNNVPFTRCVTPHELIPGHHLQGFMERRFATHRDAFRTPFLVEGWALYWEMLEWDLGWARTPEERVGMLFWRMHRAARIVVSLGFHLGDMTPDEMITLLVERVGHERDNAVAEVRRYIRGDYGPLYQCGYMIGGLQLRALRADLVDTGRMTDREFHDAVLRVGPIPIEMVRALLTGEAPAADHRAAWRFARHTTNGDDR